MEVVKKYEVTDSRIEDAFIEYMEKEYEYILFNRLFDRELSKCQVDTLNLLTEKAKEIVEEVFDYINFELGKIEIDLGDLIFDSVKFTEIYNSENHIYYSISIDFTDNKDQEVKYAGHFVF